MALPAPTALPRGVVWRFLAAMACGNLLWETVQMPLYTLWLTGTSGEIAYAIVHCTLGDVLIAAASLGFALLLAGRGRWPRRAYGRVALVTILLALGYTVFSEWLNTEVRDSWAYRDLMPRLPVLGTGLTPVLQWIAVPLAAFRWAVRGRRGPSAVA